jgi:hypothetical protein
VVSTRIDDKFDSSGATPGDDANDPTDAAWSGINATRSVVADPTGFNSGNALSVVTSGGTFDTNLAGFSTAALAVGDTLTYSMKFRLGSTPVAGSFRFGLQSTSGTVGTYEFDINTGSTAGVAIGKRPSAAVSGSDESALTITGSPSASINDQLPHFISLSVARTASSVNLTAQYDGNTYTATDSTSPLVSFNQVDMGQGGTSMTFLIDNVLVPEPASMSVMGLAALGLLARRRRSRE